MRLITIISLFHFQFINGQLFDMKCNYTEASLDYYSKRTCNTIDLNIENLDQVLNSVDGQKTILEDVVGLVIENQVVRHLPYFIDVYFPKLRFIHIESSKLRWISKYDLEPFPDLQALSLIDNELQFLDGDLFTLTTKIKNVQLEDDNLFVINGALFSPLKLLTTIEIVLPCMEKECLSHDCVVETVSEFKHKCEYDSIFPGFQEYFKYWLNTYEECEYYESLTSAKIKD